jgi:8-oxo-dGTP pyrophosphatase MutT (NUDIX family)
MVFMKEELRKALAMRPKRHVIEDNYEPAAVLVPIYNNGTEYNMLFTRRTNKVLKHKGEISFPGGVVEKWDVSLIDTALRECNEEIGLRADEVEVLGELDDMATLTGYVISPFVGIIPYPYQFTINRNEIEEIMEIPISSLLDDNSSHFDDMNNGIQVIPPYSYNYQGKIIWGATARILNQFLDIYRQIM